MSIGGFTPAMPSVANDARAHDRTTTSSQRAAQAAGGENKESEATGDRDADGRQAWQWHQRQKKQQAGQEQKVPDISGKTGTTLDLNG